MMAQVVMMTMKWVMVSQVMIAGCKDGNRCCNRRRCTTGANVGTTDCIVDVSTAVTCSRGIVVGR